MPKQRKKIPPGQRLAKKLRRRKQPLKRRAKVNYRYWRMRAKALLREKRVEKAELLDWLFERDFLKLLKRPADLKLFCNRAITRIQKKVDRMKGQLLASFSETQKIKLPAFDTPKKDWTAEERQNNKLFRKRVRAENLLERRIKDLNAELEFLDELRSSAESS